MHALLSAQRVGACSASCYFLLPPSLAAATTARRALRCQALSRAGGILSRVRDGLLFMAIKPLAVLAGAGSRGYPWTGRPMTCRVLATMMGWLVGSRSICGSQHCAIWQATQQKSGCIASVGPPCLSSARPCRPPVLLRQVPLGPVAAGRSAGTASVMATVATGYLSSCRAQSSAWERAGEGAGCLGQYWVKIVLYHVYWRNLVASRRASGVPGYMARNAAANLPGMVLLPTEAGAGGLASYH